MCTKFQLNRSLFSQVMAENANSAKWRRKKTKKLFWNFVHSYLGIDWHNLLQIWYVDLPSLGASVEQIWLNSGKWFQNYIGVKITFFVFLSIYSRWHNDFLGHMTHYCVSWYVFNRVIGVYVAILYLWM